MSYSVNARAASKSAAVTAIHAKLDEVLSNQPIHSRDIEQAKSAAAAFVEVLTEPTGEQEILVTVSGSLGWHGDSSGPTKITSAQVGVNAYHVPRGG